MILAFLTGIFCKVFIGQPFGLGQDRRRNLSRIVKCKPSDSFRRCIADRSETNRHDGARRHLDFDHKTDEQLVEYLDFCIGQFWRLSCK